MPDIDDIFDDEEDRATYATRETDGPTTTAATPEDDDPRIGVLLRGANDALRARDAAIARATAAEAALAAVTAERDRVREALQGVIGMAENFLELHMMSSAKKDPDIIRARAALSAKEATDER